MDYLRRVMTEPMNQHPEVVAALLVLTLGPVAWLVWRNRCRS